jgi:type I restriction enzyme, S subunit
MRRYSAYKDSNAGWIGEIPDHWRIEKFRWVTKLSAERYGDDAIERPMLSLSAYDGIKIKDYEYETQRRTEEQNATYVVVKPNQLVVNPMWVMKRSIGVSELHGIASPAYRVYDISDELRPKYLHFLMRSDIYVEEYNRHIRGLTTYDRSVRKDDFAELLMPIPPHEEQDAIVTFLEEKTAVIHQFITNKRRLIELLQEQKQAIINTAVTQGLDPHVPRKASGIPWLGDIPAHWTRMAIKYTLYGIIDTEHKTVSFHDDGEYLVVRTSNVKQGKLVLNDAKYTDKAGYKGWTRRGEPAPGDIIFTREAPAGEACIVPEEPIVCLGQRTVLFKVYHSLLIPEFGVYSIYGGTASQFITLLSQGSTVAHFNMSDIGNIPMLIPPLSEQREIVAYLNRRTAEIDAAIERAQREIELIEEYRTTLIAHAVTGKIDVRGVAAANGPTGASP